MDKEADLRVKLSSKKVVVEQLKKYEEQLKRSLDTQTGITEESKQLLLKELLTNFQTAVQDNLLINGQPWEDAPDDDEDACASLDNLLDDSIVETARKRRKYPQEILPHVVRSLKAERKLMGMFEQAVKPEQLQKDPLQESIMSGLSAAAPGMFKQASSMMKSQQVLQQGAEGLRQVLNMRASPASLEVHRAVFGLPAGEPTALPPPPPRAGASRTRPPIRRAVQEAETGGCYAPPLKRQVVAQGKPE